MSRVGNGSPSCGQGVADKILLAIALTIHLSTPEYRLKQGHNTEDNDNLHLAQLKNPTEVGVRHLRRH